MKLTSFRVTDFRSIKDSGEITVDKNIAFVGRNESGKTNILLALHSLKPSTTLTALSFTKDFPRDKHKSEFREETIVISSVWQLTDSESLELENLFPRATGIKKVEIDRPYKGMRYVGFQNLPPVKFNLKSITPRLTSLGKEIDAAASAEADANKKNIIQSSFKPISDYLIKQPKDPIESATALKSALLHLRQQIATQSAATSTVISPILNEIFEEIDPIVEDKNLHDEAIKWVIAKMPNFIYLSDYAQLEGHQKLSEYLNQRNQNGKEEVHKNFERLCKVAGLDPNQLNNLLSNNHEDRHLLTNRAGAAVTKVLRDLWKDRALKVRFQLDGDHFDTLVSDPGTEYDVEVNLNERSNGFKWFFSFFVTFAADTAGGPSENSILLLDEPGLFLHAVAQRDLISYFENGLKNQIMYTTHSPFMIPVHNLASVKTVNLDVKAGTTVTNDPTGDSKTLFPLQSALGYDLSQMLFIGQRNLVVEGISDFWYLSSIADYLSSTGSNLPSDLTITPAGGAQKVSYMVALLSSQKLKVLVLLDSEKQSRITSQDLIKSKIIAQDYVLFVSEALEDKDKEADIEDLIDENVYDTLVKKSYQKELKGIKLTLNANIPRIVKRYENAFETAGLQFNKIRPAKLFLREIADKPESVIGEDSSKRFLKLFFVISDRLKKLES